MAPFNNWFNNLRLDYCAEMGATNHISFDTHNDILYAFRNYIQIFRMLSMCDVHRENIYRDARLLFVMSIEYHS